jgi:predicted DNA-binding antitoxin AbrB/MazE fold protein
MSQRLRAVYRKGAFHPRESCDLPDGSEVELTVQGPFILPPDVKEPKEQKRILRTVINSMQGNPIPAGAPPLTRDSLHDRR